MLKDSHDVESTLGPSSELSTLLNALAAGAGQQLFTVNDWAARLGDGELAHQFTDQMREEWHSITVPDALCQAKMDAARGYIGWYLGWPHIWAHTLRVTGTILTLAAEANVDPAHAFMMGIFHDIGKLDELSGGDSHEEIGARVLHEKLDGHYTGPEITLMASVIAKRASSINPYARLLYDADKLDKIGATGLARRLSTRWGSEHIPYAIQRVRDDAEDFPEMHYATSRELAKSKFAFTRRS